MGASVHVDKQLIARDNPNECFQLEPSVSLSEIEPDVNSVFVAPKSAGEERV